MEVELTGKQLAVLILIGIFASSWLVGFAFLRGRRGEEEKKVLDKFAKCLSKQGATLYTIPGCRYCQKQRKLFGKSFRFISRVDCYKKRQECRQKGITQVPTWIINEKKYVGPQPIKRLSKLTGCKL